MLNKGISSSRGVALILVLWMLVLTTIMAGSFALTMRRELSMVSNARDLAEASALTEAGITYALQMLKVTDPEIQWLANGNVYEIEFENSIIRIKIINESGKISINNPDRKLLQGVLQQAGLEEEDQNSLIDNILDWQDADDLIQLNGAEIDDYEQEGRKYGPANKPFQTLDELQMVLDMDAALFKQLEPLLTVYSVADKINPQYAQKDVLLSLPDVEDEAILSFIQQREESTKNAMPAPEFPYPEYVSGNSSGVFTFIAEARLSSGNTGMTKAMIANSTSSTGLPYSILEWHVAPINEQSLFVEGN